MSAQVTAMGIRDGDPAVLQALVNRRGSAVLAYCEAACGPGAALDAAADAFMRFRAQVLAADRPGDIDPEVALLSGTRHAAASRAPRPPATGGATGAGLLMGGTPPADRLPDVPDLLADRADGVISPEDGQALEVLLDASPLARASEQRFIAAEKAYRAAPRVALPPSVTAQIVATMGTLAAAPGNGTTPADEVPAPPDGDADADPGDDGAALEWRLEGPQEPDAPVDVDAAVPQSAEIAAARGEAVDPDGTVEWTVPEDELGESPGIEHEISAARLDDTGQDEDPAHLPTASGAVPEDDVSVSPLPAPASPTAPGHRRRRGVPGRAALAPAAAVVAVAAIGAMAASGVFGGNDPSPTVDTGIVPERALQAVPEGEARAVVDDLRAASADARRRRLADRRRQIAAEQATPSPGLAEEPATAPESAAAAPADEPTSTGETSAPEATDGDENATGREDAAAGGAESP